MNSHPTLLHSTGMTGSTPLLLSVSLKQNKLYFPDPGPKSRMWRKMLVYFMVDTLEAFLCDLLTSVIITCKIPIEES